MFGRARFLPCGLVIFVVDRHCGLWAAIVRDAKAALTRFKTGGVARQSRLRQPV